MLMAHANLSAQSPLCSILSGDEWKRKLALVDMARASGPSDETKADSLARDLSEAGLQA